MKEDLPVQPGVTLLGNELEITASRSGGPGGQHVNKTSSRITLRWNLHETTALSENQKMRVLSKLSHELTKDGDLIIHHSSSRSQYQNKEQARQRLAEKLREALKLVKKRKKTYISKGVKESRLQQKKQRSVLKKERREKH